jgi:phage tail protein X
MTDSAVTSRLSDEKIEDVIIRSYLYRDILKSIRENSVTTTAYELKHDEKYRPDLVAFRVYGNTAARWLVKLLCDTEDEERALPVGTTIRFPDIAYVRERIRHFENGGGI